MFSEEEFDVNIATTLPVDMQVLWTSCCVFLRVFEGTRGAPLVCLIYLFVLTSYIPHTLYITSILLILLDYFSQLFT